MATLWAIKIVAAITNPIRHSSMNAFEQPQFPLVQGFTACRTPQTILEEVTEVKSRVNRAHSPVSALVTHTETQRLWLNTPSSSSQKCSWGTSTGLGLKCLSCLIRRSKSCFSCSQTTEKNEADFRFRSVNFLNGNTAKSALRMDGLLELLPALHQT